MAVSADAGVLQPAVHLTVGPEVVVGSQMPVDNKKNNYVLCSSQNSCIVSKARTIN